jgi:ubiquinone/menaquinone biosynthesis C-methylase UbiE
MTPSDRSVSADMDAWLGGRGAAVLTQLAIRKGDVVLDFGCGPGTYTIPLAQVVGSRGRVIALDRSAAQLEELKRRIAGSPFRDRIDIVQSDGDLTLDGIQDASLDAALLFDVLQHVENWRLLVSSLHRGLAPGGLLLINPSRLSHPGRVDLERLESILAEAAFTVERTVRDRVAHYDRIREEEILVCRRPQRD